MNTPQLSYLFGALTIAVFSVLSTWKKKTPQLSDAVILLLSATAIPPCCKVISIFYAYDGTSIKQIGGNEQSYIIIGAFSVIWISLNEIYKKFKDLY